MEGFDAIRERHGLPQGECTHARVPGLVGLAAEQSRHMGAQHLEIPGVGAFELQHLVSRGVVQCAHGVAHALHDERGIRLAQAQQRFLVVAVGPDLLGDQEAGADDHAANAERQRRDDLRAQSDAATQQDRNAELAAGERALDHASDQVDPGVPAAFRPHDRHRIDADRLGLERVAQRRRLVQYLDARRVEHRQIGLGVAPRGFHEAHARARHLVEGFLDTLARRRRRQHRHIDAERESASQVLAARDLVAQRGSVGEAGGRDEPHDPGTGGCGDVIGIRQPLQAAGNNGKADTEHFGDRGGERLGHRGPLAATYCNGTLVSLYFCQSAAAKSILFFKVILCFISTLQKGLA